MIKVNEFINTHTIEEHNRFADAYFHNRENDIYLYQKPFYNPLVCAPLVESVGKLLGIAKLSHGLKVLDFAAGTCWLSRILVQLECEVVCCDASQTALDIGKKLFEKYPPISDDYPKAIFSLFDGIKLDFADNSFDRIVVNDAFHHIANTSDVLREFYRVLKDDGIVAMSEPGRNHSTTKDSQYEMKTYNVIENDFVLEDIWEESSKVGFKDIVISPVLMNTQIDLEEYQSIIKGDIPRYVTAKLKQDTLNHTIFAIYKKKQESQESSYKTIKSEDFFDEDFYLQKHPDVSQAIKKGAFESGWHHYELYGKSEFRTVRKK